MAINPESEFPGKITPSSADYPYGEARNITVPGDGTGTPWIASLVNDIFGFQQALLSASGVVPSGTPEKATASQYREAMIKLAGGVKATVASMKADLSIKPGQRLITIDYSASRRGGGAPYLCKTTAQATTDGDVIDEDVNHTLDNGDVAIQQEGAALRHVLQAGTVSDGTTSDATLLNALIAAGFFRTEGGSYGLDNPIQILNDIVGGSFTYNAGASQAFTFFANDTTLKNATIVSDKHGVQNTQVTDHVNLLSCKITADSFGVLYNDSSDGSTKSRIAFCDIYSDTADAIELNNPSRGSSAYMMIGNWLHADTNGVSSNSGFSVGTAGINGHIALGNYSTESRNEAYHTEDTQLLGLHMGNIYDGCLEDGTFISGQFEAQPLADGLLSIGNRFKYNGVSAATALGSNYAFPTANGSLDMCVGIGEYFDGFGTGLSLTAKVLSYHGGNAIVNADTAVIQKLSSICIGDNITNAGTTLFQGEGASLIGGVHSKEKPTNVVVNSGPATQIGSAIKRFSWKTAYTHAAGGATELFDLFAAGDLIQGRITCILQNGTSNFIASAEITWDGTTFTELNFVKKIAGNIGGTMSFQENAGRIELSVVVAGGTAITVGNLIVDFDGVYFVQ